MRNNGAGGRLRGHQSDSTKAGPRVRTGESNTHSASIQRTRSEVLPTGRNKGDMVKASYYRRVLPSPPAIDFTSDEADKLFDEAKQAGMMVGFFMLISQFQTQSEPAYCGLASLAMVLNALAIDPRRTWKGPWRWFDEAMLAYPEELEKIKAKGISFRKAVCLAKRAGAEVKAFQTSETDVDVEFFRRSVKKCCSSRNCHLVSSYDRDVLEQAGTGHFSPIGGYHGERDMVLILDVARFKYPCHWAPLTVLWKAMDTVDETTGQRRGFMLISKPKRDAGLLYILSCKNESWVGVVRCLMDKVPHLLKSENVKDINGILHILLASPLSGVGKFIQSVAEVKREQECGVGISEEEKQRLVSREELLKQVRDTGFSDYIVNFLSSTSCCSRVPVSGDSENLHEIAASVCSHGAEILSGKSSTSGCSCCHETYVKCMKADGHKTPTVLSATIMKVKNEEKVNMLVPQSLMKLCSGTPDPNNCTSTRPVASDILTVLLLMLPRKTWCSIKDEELWEEVRSLVSTDKLPAMLQREVSHLRRRLYNLKKRQNTAKKKSAFDQKEVSFLGHIDKGEPVRMDKANICGLTNITTLVMDMLKEEKSWKWTDKYQKEFDQLKQFMTKEAMLVFPNHTKPYEVETDVSDYGIGGVLMQDEHPMAFKSRKLNDAERWYTVQGKVDPNSVTNPLYCHHIKKELKHDQRAQNLIGGKPRKEVLHEWHDSKYAWPLAKTNTTSLIEDQYYQPQMRDDLEACMKTSLVCQQDKLEQQSPSGLLEPLPIPTRPWESVFMNFIMNLPKSKECQTLMIVVDRFSKNAIFVLAKDDCPAEEAVKLFLNHVVTHRGVPQTIVSPQFTEPLWIELFKHLGSKLNFSISPHPQTDDETGMVNALLEIYFRHYMNTRQADWAELINVAQFSYNLQFTSKSLFEIMTGQQPQTPSMVASDYQENSPSAYKYIKDWQGRVDLAQARLHEALEHMKKWTDKKGWHVEFQVGDSVYVKLHAIFQEIHKDLNCCYLGPFVVLQRVGKVAYKLKLPPELEVHPIFHVSMLNHKEYLD